MKGERIWMMLSIVCIAFALDTGAGAADGWARSRKPHVAHVKIPRIRTPRAPRARRYTSRSVSVRQADGTVLRGYRDSYGTHLRGPDGKPTNCQRSSLGGSDINIACR